MKQNPVNRDRIAEANKLIYSLQKQVNQLRDALTALAVEVDENVEKKVQIRVEIGNEVKEVEATLLKDEYTFTVSGVTFGEADSVSVVAKVDDETFISAEGEFECAEGGDVEIKGKAQKTEASITIKKSAEPEPTDKLTVSIKIGDAEAVDMTTTDNLTFTHTFEAQEADTVIVLTPSKAGFKLSGETPAVTTASTEISVTFVEDETITEVTPINITVTQA